MALSKLELVRFYDYEIDRARWQLCWQQQPITLNRKTFDLLLYLVDHRDKVVGKDELLQALWPDQFVEESNLTQHVFLLRKALSRHEPGGKIIETISGRGYRFAAPVVEPGDAPQAAPTHLSFAASESITRITLEEEQEVANDTALSSPRRPLPRAFASRRLFWAAASAGLALLLALAAWFGWQRWQDHSGGPPIQVVLTPLGGTTGDPILDASLTQALRMDLAQSPYVSVLPSSTMSATLAQMMRKTGEKITPEMAREICERTNSQAYLSGNIAKIGARFLITAEATNCVDNSMMAATKFEAPTAEDLPHAMDKLAANLRRKLGESRASIARFNAPLFHDNTPSLEALKAFTQATQAMREGKFTEAIALLKLAIADDPNFATAHYNLAAAYGSIGDDLHVRESIARAYSLKDSAPKSTQFAIATMYDSEYTGDLYELVRTFKGWVALYPNSSQAWSGLANAQRAACMDADALASSLRTVELLPHSQGMRANLALDQMRNGDGQAARATCERTVRDNLDGDGIRLRYLQVAYLLGDPALLEEQKTWADLHPNAMGVLGIQSQIAMAEGRFADARKIMLRIREIHRQQGTFGPDDESTKFGAVDLMQVGDQENGKKLFQLSPIDPEEGQQVLGLVYIGDIAGAQAGLRANQAKYPRATMWNLFWGPRILAAIAMAEHKPAEAAALLETVRPLDNITPATPWQRGNAYLAAAQPALAEKEFRSVVAHPELEPPSPYISVAWLGLGRALAAEGNRPAALDAYRHFLSRWAHADPDTPTLKQARQEMAQLQQAP